MKLERSNIRFHLWRKKVDASLFKESSTPIPKWLWNDWYITDLFSNSTSKDSDCLVKILFGGKEYKGYVVKKKNREYYSLSFDKHLSDALKDKYLMSYMRSIEQDLRKKKSEYKGQEIENEIPFWEFLDIEFDYQNRVFYFNAYYLQNAVFVELYIQKLIDPLFRFI